MNKINKLFAQITNKKVKSSTYLPVGLTNDDYLIETIDNLFFIIRIPKKLNYKLFNYANEYKIIKSLKKTNLDVETVYFNEKTGIKITKYIKDLKSFSNSKLNLNKKLKLVANAINIIHAQKANKEIIFNPFAKLSNYQKLAGKKLFNDQDELIKQCLYYYKKDKHVLCHNDLVDGNLLFSTKRLYLIDYEYAGYNHPMFDLASFLSENNIENKVEIVKFLKYYYQNDYSASKYEQVMDWYRFNDLLWSYWAFMMYKKENKKIFKNIFNQKSRRYKKNK
jgi:thiamine kinase-like enzyme